MSELTAERRKNLEVLADFLDSAVPPPKFSMALYLEIDISSFPHLDNYCEVVAEIATPEVYSHCGTVACACGHGPLAGIKPLEGEGWGAYSARCFTGNDPSAWSWLFHEAWERTDNTAKGAAARIRWYLERGVPDDYWEQIEGLMPLCYTVSA